MATYKEIQEVVKNKHGFSPKTCWIAHVFSALGKNMRQAPNRHDNATRKHPCPPNKWAKIEQVIRELEGL